MTVDFFVENIDDLDEFRDLLSLKYKKKVFLKSNFKEFKKREKDYIYIHFELQKSNYPFFLTISNIPLESKEDVINIGIKLSTVLNSEVLIIDDLFNCLGDEEIGYVIINKNKDIFVGKDLDLDVIDFEIIGSYINGSFVKG